MLQEKKKKNTFVAENAENMPKAYPVVEWPSLRIKEREMISKYNNNNQLINLKN